MIKTATITQIDGVKPWEGNSGTVYYHNLQLDNGDKINIGKKQEVKVGWDITYSLTNTEVDGYIKAKSERPTEASNYAKPETPEEKTTSIIKQTCIKAACTAVAGKQVSTDVIIQMAGHFEDWILGKSVNKTTNDLPS